MMIMYFLYNKNIYSTVHTVLHNFQVFCEFYRNQILKWRTQKNIFQTVQTDLKAFTYVLYFPELEF
jgi:hypothetical protein